MAGKFAKNEREPQNEARFADCAIFGERRLFINAEAALAFLGKTSVKISGENRPKYSCLLKCNDHACLLWLCSAMAQSA